MLYNFHWIYLHARFGTDLILAYFGSIALKKWSKKMMIIEFSFKFIFMFFSPIIFSFLFLKILY